MFDPRISHSLIARSDDPDAMTPAHECPTRAVSAGARIVPLGAGFDTPTSVVKNGLDVFRKSQNFILPSEQPVMSKLLIPPGWSKMLITGCVWL